MLLGHTEFNAFSRPFALRFGTVSNANPLGMKWLDKNSRKQQEWTQTYLQTKGSIKRSDEPLMHEKFMEIGERLEHSKDGQPIIQKVREGLYLQAQNRSDHGAGIASGKERR